MGYIRACENRYQTNIRRKGYPRIPKTFTRREAAYNCSKSTEIRKECGEFNPHSKITVEELIKRHAKEVVPKQSSSNRVLYRCNTFRQILGKYLVPRLRVISRDYVIPTSIG